MLLSEFLITKARLYAFVFGQNAILIIGFLHLNKDQRHAMYQQGNIGSELFIVLPTGSFSDYMQGAIRKILKVYQLCARTIDEFFVESPPKIFVLQTKRHFIQYPKRIRFVQFRIDTLYALVESIRKNIRQFVLTGSFNDR